MLRTCSSIVFMSRSKVVYNISEFLGHDVVA